MTLKTIKIITLHPSVTTLICVKWTDSEDTISKDTELQEWARVLAAPTADGGAAFKVKPSFRSDPIFSLLYFLSYQIC